jgi:hypothetical protein
LSALADLSIALVELLEAEGRALERGLVRVTASSGLAISAAVLGLAGLGLCLWGVYLYLATVLAAPLAALATGLLTLTVSGGLLWTALRVGR